MGIFSTPTDFLLLSKPFYGVKTANPPIENVVCIYCRHTPGLEPFIKKRIFQSFESALNLTSGQQTPSIKYPEL